MREAALIRATAYSLVFYRGRMQCAMNTTTPDLSGADVLH